MSGIEYPVGGGKIQEDNEKKHGQPEGGSGTFEPRHTHTHRVPEIHLAFTLQCITFRGNTHLTCNTSTKKTIKSLYVWGCMLGFCFGTQEGASPKILGTTDVNGRISFLPNKDGVLIHNC